MKILVVSDNPCLVRKFVEILHKKGDQFRRSNKLLFAQELKKVDRTELEEFSQIPINLKTDIKRPIGNYAVDFSIYCKQIFPKMLVESVRCINLHPGLDSHNRNWYPISWLEEIMLNAKTILDWKQIFSRH